MGGGGDQERVGYDVVAGCETYSTVQNCTDHNTQRNKVSPVQCSTVQYITVQYNTVRCSGVQYGTVRCLLVYVVHCTHNKIECVRTVRAEKVVSLDVILTYVELYSIFTLT